MILKLNKRNNSWENVSVKDVGTNGIKGYQGHQYLAQSVKPHIGILKEKLSNKL